MLNDSADEKSTNRTNSTEKRTKNKIDTRQKQLERENSSKKSGVRLKLIVYL